jgi:molecular chaperone Hsp33
MDKKNIKNVDLKTLLKQRAKNRLHRFLLSNGEVRGVMVHATLMVNEMRDNFELGVLETYVLGQAYIAAALLSANLQKNDRMGLSIECSGPIKGLNVEATASGEVRGFLKNVPIPLDKPLESFDLSEFFGAGLITYTKYLEDAKQPYSGTIALMHGNIAMDLAEYFLSSEQIPTAFHLSIQFDKDGLVIGAGGLFLQALPGASDETVADLDSLMENIKSVGKCFSEDMSAQDYIESEFKEFSPKQIGDQRVEFFCRCSKNQMTNYLSMLPIDDITDLAVNGPFPMETRCHSCNSLYSFTKEELTKICDIINNR